MAAQPVAERPLDADYVLEREGAVVMVRLRGIWTLQTCCPVGARLPRRLKQIVNEGEPAQRIELCLSEVERYDSRLVAFVLLVEQAGAALGVPVERVALPENVRQLLALAEAVPEKTDARRAPEPGWWQRMQRAYLGVIEEGYAVCEFTGLWVVSFLNLLTGRARLRWRDFWRILQDVSVDALPIVSLISFLVGLIISFLGAVTLRQFAAEFAVSYLVGYGMLREMGAVMTAVIMAGRTGAAFAAQIGSMKVNEEIDALETLGISPIDFVVLPRLLALFIMMPVLVVYANVVGVMGGWLVATMLMGVPNEVFWTEMNFVVAVPDFLVGVFKGAVFGVLVATSGCMRGLQSGSGADAVGLAATRAVVTGITLIIFANAVIDWAAATLGI